MTSNSPNDEKKDVLIDQKKKIAFSIGEVGDGVAYQTFSFLIFTFYFSVVKLPIVWISTAFIIWSVWNSFNDPIIGILSDRTKSKKGRRIVWMMGATIPLAIVMILLFTPPLGQSSNAAKMAYFVIILFLFDTIYTAFNLNYNAQWSEMFTSVKDRSEVGELRGIFVIFSLIFAFILPTILIEDLTNQYDYDYTPSQYILVGVIAAVVILISYFIVLKYGIVQRAEFINDAETAPSFIESIKYTFKNKAFRPFLIAALATWICNGILPTMIPYFATYILRIADENSLLIGAMLAAGFIVGAASMPLWMKIRQAKGARYTGIIIFIIWAISLLILMSTETFAAAFAAMLFVGLGLGGSIYFYDQCIVEIIDEDEIQYGTRRAGAYYGVVSFIIRLSGVINFLIIGIIFSGTEWETYNPNPGVDVIFGIKFLIGIFPAIVLGIGLIGLLIYPIKGRRLEEDRRKLDELHQKKLQASGTK
jgi:GPH family glycoside/pentoside/hexuronide:cation symporter